MKRIRLLSDKEIMYNRFVELCSKSIKIEDIVPGFECYCSGYEGKMKITSLPYISKYTGTLFADVISYSDDDSYSTNFSLNDRNIIQGGYNLHRIFKDEQDRDEYSKIVREYSFYVKGKNGRNELKYKVKPIPGQDFIIDKTKYEER